MPLRRLPGLLGWLAAATAGCCLAYEAAFFLAGLPGALLALFTRVELAGFQAQLAAPHILTRFPSDGSRGLYALYHGGWALSAAAVLSLGLVGARRAQGWLRLLLVYVVFWSGLLLLGMLCWFAFWRAGPLDAAARALWPAAWAGRDWRILAAAGAIGIAYIGIHQAARSLLEADPRRARLLALLGWLALPVLIAGWLLWRRVHAPSAVLRAAFTLAPPLLALLAGLPAVLGRPQGPPRPARPFAPSARGAALVLLASSLLFGVLAGWGGLARLVRRGDFVHRESARWSLQFESGGITAAGQARLASEADRRLAALEARLGLADPVPKLRARFYASADAKRALAGSDAPFTLDLRGRTIEELLAPDGSVSDPRGEALLLMYSAWGPPGSENVARAIARYATGGFHGQPLGAYAARITREEGRRSLGEVFETSPDSLSPLVSDALGGAWVESEVAARGTAMLRALYGGPFTVTGGRERDWDAYQYDNARRNAAPAADPPRSSFFHRGISFSHEPGGSRGYGSDAAAGQLAAIARLGANSVAVIPYAFTRAPRDPRLLFGTGERDDRVIRTIEQAKRLGLRVTLKPQLWAPVFTGDIAFASDADFERWFSRYRRWLLHYARLAEICDADLLVIGNELGGVTGREAAWRALIADLRRVYSGPLTYAASWGPEAERLRFWDALDYIGVNMYYPLANPGETPRPDSSRLRELVQKLATLSQKYNRPVLFTEAGYPARASAAARPWDESDGLPDAAMQARCYTVLFEAFYDQPWFAGLYWWKWPSSGEGSRFEISYSPLGKPALGVLARWYGRTPDHAVAPAN
ncbi:MAG TPA: hypothetical protein VEU62_15620 [Bryobacterales bacterium]|nr:hypothetical protein [Bryobacterales bacterium]